MELKAVTAAEKLLFIKYFCSVAGDLHHSGECFIFIKQAKTFAHYLLKLLE